MSAGRTTDGGGVIIEEAKSDVGVAVKVLYEDSRIVAGESESIEAAPSGLAKMRVGEHIVSVERRISTVVTCPSES